MRKPRTKPRFKFLDTVRIKGLGHILDLGLVVRANMSAFGDTYQIQWFDGRPDTVMHGDNLRRVKP